ncbi:UvrD-helicase domain-containing protein [Haloarcula sp. JP-L23]|uniref:UvrD-helicase domain-containing protein n=1 Tax=Haloarcula sp. JP-L23 TaxID=2716717 RepID=UPI00140EAB0F|nr:ATP-dependent helicase [Haloarcula sp. JP-L23]
MSDLSLDDIEITGIDERAADESVKLNGPPGTGKTTESAARVARLLDDYDYQLNDVLWATYRHSLAMETLERLANWGIIPESELSDPTDGPTRYIATTHACANRMVGGVGDMVTWYDKKSFAEGRSLRFDKRNPWDDPPGQLLFQVFDYAANNLLDLHEQTDREKIPMMDDLRDKYPGNVARAFDDWQDWKAQNDKFDFWEQLRAPIDQGVQANKDVVVIDEYHDATPLMAKLSERWIEQAEVAIVAGDPLQVVNTYAGADPEFFERLDVPEVLLPRAHQRPPRQHWAAATTVLENAHIRPPVEIDNSGSFHTGSSPRFSHSGENGWNVPSPDTPRSPAHMVENYGTDMMFLSRTQRQAAGVARALEKAGILFEVQNSMDVDGWGAKEEMAERTALYNALQRLEGVTPGSSGGSGLMAYSDSDSGSMTPSDVRLRAREAAALLDHTNHQYLSESRSDVTQAANEIVGAEVVVHGDELNEYVEAEFWDVYTRGSGTVRHLNNSGASDMGSAIDDRDREAMKAALNKNDDPVRGVETKVYTIHASKGSEAKNVVVYDGITRTIEEGMLESEKTRKNEYRTWYVALTRSRANLFVLRDGFEWTSPFLPETLLEAAKDAHEQGANA